VILAVIVIALLFMLAAGAARAARTLLAAFGGLIFCAVLVAAYGWPVLAVAAAALLWTNRTRLRRT